jgi:hypothetical protein
MIFHRFIFILATCMLRGGEPVDTDGAESAQDAVPGIEIVYPKEESLYSSGMSVRITTALKDPSYPIKDVHFFAETNEIGIATNAPFALWWNLDTSRGSLRTLRAVARAESGISATSPPVRVVISAGGVPPFCTYEITAPRNAEIFLAPATFTFSAEAMAFTRGAPTWLYVGTNLVATFGDPPFSMTVTNLNSGTYKLTVRGFGSEYEGEPVVSITVADLWIRSTRKTEDGRIELRILTAYPGRETVLYRSSDLANWLPINTNAPAQKTFEFLVPDDPAATQFYHVAVPR